LVDLGFWGRVMAQQGTQATRFPLERKAVGGKRYAPDAGRRYGSVKRAIPDLAHEDRRCSRNRVSQGVAVPHCPSCRQPAAGQSGFDLAGDAGYEAVVTGLTNAL
jgi:hypothetical protein